MVQCGKRNEWFLGLGRGKPHDLNICKFVSTVLVTHKVLEWVLEGRWQKK